jgi:hypothetical protein
MAIPVELVGDILALAQTDVDSVPRASAHPPLDSDARLMRDKRRKVFNDLRENSYSILDIFWTDSVETLFKALEADLVENGWIVSWERLWDKLGIFIVRHPDMDEEIINIFLKDRLCFLRQRV